MVTHVPIRVGLTRTQAMKLAKGGNIRIPHHKLRGPHVLHVTLKAARRHARAHRMRTGMVLPAHAVHGGSLRTVLHRLMGAVRGVAGALKPVASRALREYGLTKLASHLSSRYHPLAGHAATALGEYGLSKLGLGRRRRHHSVGGGRASSRRSTRSVATRRARSHNPFAMPRSVQGFSTGRPAMVQGVGRRRHRSHMRGGAWYDDLWSGVKSVANVAKPFVKLAAPLVGLIPHPAAKVASLALGGLGRRRLMRARGLYPATGHGVSRRRRVTTSRRGHGLYAQPRGRGLFP